MFEVATPKATHLHAVSIGLRQSDWGWRPVIRRDG